MRPDGVVFDAEVVEAVLLLAQGARRRFCRIRLERAVEALVPAVVFGMTGDDEVRGDIERAHPETEARETARRTGSAERRPIVAQNRLRPTIGWKQCRSAARVPEVVGW